MAHLFTRSAFIVKSLPHSWLILSFAAHKGNEISVGFPSIPVQFQWESHVRFRDSQGLSVGGRKDRADLYAEVGLHQLAIVVLNVFAKCSFRYFSPTQNSLNFKSVTTQPQPELIFTFLLSESAKKEFAGHMIVKEDMFSTLEMRDLK